MLVLVADDDRLLRRIVRHRLEGRGFSVEEAENGAKALERLAADPLPDALILDAMMPVVDGFETLRRVREQPRTAGLPVLMLTLRKGEDDIVGALTIGADEYLVKPFLPDELVLRLQRAVAARGRRIGP